jgi:uncharacterized protein (UPF0335 family)
MELDYVIDQFKELFQELHSEGFDDNDAYDYVFASMKIAYLSHKGVLK